MPGELRSARADGPPSVLRARAFRSVSLERDERGRAVVVKRFHHPNPLLALFDGVRARREHAALSALARAGLAVPEVRALRRSAVGWELVLAPIEDARTLDTFFANSTPPDGGWSALCARLGELLAALHCAGWEHGDLHPGNVLLDARGAPWLIDFTRARRRAPFDARARRDDLVRVAAVAREVVPASALARFLRAWLRALPRELRPRETPVALAQALEQEGRAQRIALVRVGLGRWLRASSRVRLHERAGERLLLRQDLCATALDALTDEARFLVLRGARAELRARWLGAARLHEHRVPVARPAVFAPGRLFGTHAWAAFELPSVRTHTPAALAALLAERGLALRAPQELLGDGYFLPPRERTDFTT